MNIQISGTSSRTRLFSRISRFRPSDAYVKFEFSLEFVESRTAICEVLFEEGRLNFIPSQPTNKITSQSSSYRVAKNAAKFHWCNWNFHWRSIFECACSTGWIDNGWIDNDGIICYYGYFWYGFDYGQLRIVCDYNKYNQFKWRYLYYLRLNEVTWGHQSTQIFNPWASSKRNIN